MLSSRGQACPALPRHSPAPPAVPLLPRPPHRAGGGLCNTPLSNSHVQFKPSRGLLNSIHASDDVDGIEATPGPMPYLPSVSDLAAPRARRRRERARVQVAREGTRLDVGTRGLRVIVNFETAPMALKNNFYFQELLLFQPVETERGLSARGVHDLMSSAFAPACYLEFHRRLEVVSRLCRHPNV